MNCAVLEGAAACVHAEDAEAAARIDAMHRQGIPVRLVVRATASDGLVHRVSYSAHSVLHAFVKVTETGWAMPLLATAERCGIRAAVTMYPIVPGAVRCADVLENMTALAVDGRCTFLFMFPRITLPVERDGDRLTIGGRPVNPDFVKWSGEACYPSYEYIRAFMRKAHKYFDCTEHLCGMCGRDCRLCMPNGSAGRETP